MIPGGRLFAAEHHAGLLGPVADVARQHLVHADAAVELGAFVRADGEEIPSCRVAATPFLPWLKRPFTKLFSFTGASGEGFTELHMPGALAVRILVLHWQTDAKALGRGGRHAAFRQRSGDPTGRIRATAAHGNARTGATAAEIEPFSAEELSWD